MRRGSGADVADAPGLPLSTPERVRVGILMMVGCSMIFASLDATAKLMGAYYAVFEIVWLRYTVHVMVMLAVFLPAMGLRMLRAHHLRWQIVRGLILVLCTGLSFTGLRLMPLAEVTAISFVTPLMVTLLAGPLLGEKVGMARWGAVALGFAGVVIIVRPGSGIFGWAALIPLGLACANAFFHILSRKYAGADDPVTTLFFSGLVGAVLASFALPFVWKTPAPEHWPALLLMGLLGGGGHLLLVLCFRRAPASVLAPFTYTQLAFATLIGIFIMHHMPDRWSLVGMGVIALAGLYAVGVQAWEHRSRRRRVAAGLATRPMAD